MYGYLKPFNNSTGFWDTCPSSQSGRWLGPGDPWYDSYEFGMPNDQSTWLGGMFSQPPAVQRTPKWVWSKHPDFSGVFLWSACLFWTFLVCFSGLSIKPPFKSIIQQLNNPSTPFFHITCFNTINFVTGDFPAMFHPLPRHTAGGLLKYSSGSPCSLTFTQWAPMV